MQEHIINQFRGEVLHLPAVSWFGGFAHEPLIRRLPFTYCWSPALVPKPPDWGDNIDVVRDPDGRKLLACRKTHALVGCKPCLAWFSRIISRRQSSVD